MEQNLDSLTYDISQFWEAGAEYAYMPHWPHCWDCEDDDARYSYSLDALRQLLVEKGAGAILKMVPDEKHNFYSDPICTA